MFKFSLLDWKYPFQANLIQKGNIIWLRWNLVPRLVQICWIRRQCPFDLLWTEDTLFEKIWSKKIKLSIFYHCLSRSQNETYKKCQIFLFYIKNYKRKLKKTHSINCKNLSVQYEVDHVILPSSTLCMPLYAPVNNMLMFNFPSLIFIKVWLNCYLNYNVIAYVIT